MRTHDTIPEKQDGQPFPIGDIADNPSAHEWLQSMQSLEWRNFMSKTEEAYKHNIEPTHLSRVNHILAEELVLHWTQQDDDLQSHQRSLAGYIIARQFVSETNLLPPSDAELRMALIRMKHENTAREFAQSAWRGMQHSHPRVFMYHEQILQHADSESNLAINEDSELFIAGLALPYMLSQAACLAKESNDSAFTGMSDEKRNIATSFRDCFSSDLPLASHYRDKRGVKS